jgi:hypothetical protein
MEVTQTDQNEDPIKLTSNFITHLGGAAEWIAGLLDNSLKRYKKQKQGVWHG